MGNNVRLQGRAKSRASLLLLATFSLGLVSCTSGSVDQGLGSASNTGPVPAQGVGNTQPTQPANTQTLSQEAAQTENGQTTSAQPLTEIQNPTPAQQAATQTASLNTEPPVAAPISKKITFLPVTGAPQSAVTSLAKSIRTEADKRNIQLLSTNQTGADYQVKGYFSALDDGTGTLVVYVWDILDQSGRRVHRISGNERTSQNSTNPWSAISESELQRVTDTTMAKIESWLQRQKS